MSARKGNNGNVGASPRAQAKRAEASESEPSLADRILIEERLAAARTILIRVAVRGILIFAVSYAAYLLIQIRITPLVPEGYMWIPYSVIVLCTIVAFAALGKEFEGRVQLGASGVGKDVDPLAPSTYAQGNDSCAIVGLALLNLAVILGAWMVAPSFANFLLPSFGLPDLGRFVGVAITFPALVALYYWSLRRLARRALRAAGAKAGKPKA